MASKETTEAIHDIGVRFDDTLEVKKTQLLVHEAIVKGAAAVVSKLEEQLKSMKEELSKAVSVNGTTSPAAELTYQYLQRMVAAARLELITAEKVAAVKMGETAALVEAVATLKKIYDEISIEPPPPPFTLPPEATRNPPVLECDVQNNQKKEDEVTPTRKNKKLELSRKLRDARKSGKNIKLRDVLNEDSDRELEPPVTQPEPTTTEVLAPGT
jgi:hypothetical protein